MPRTLTASSVAPRTLSESSLAILGGTYPGVGAYPGSDVFPGKGSDLNASEITTTTDYIPATVPFSIQTGSRILFANPIT